MPQIKRKARRRQTSGQSANQNTSGISTSNTVNVNTGVTPLDKFATEAQLAEALQSYLPPLRCVGEDWYVYESGVWNKTCRDEYKPIALALQSLECRAARKANEILRHVEYANQVSAEGLLSFHFWKDDEIFINCANAVLAVTADHIRNLPHSDKYLFTRQLAANYVIGEPCHAFLKAVAAALPDPQDQKLLQSFSGYILMPDCRDEAALICYGEAGTSKSTVSTGIEAVLGDGLVTTCSLAQISNPENKNLAKLAFSAVNLSTELNAVEVGSENFKLLCSGEAIDADRKFKDSIKLFTKCKLWFNANHLPKFKSGTDAELRRLHFLRFRILVGVPDLQLKDNIRIEADGVFEFMLKGLQTLLSEKRMPEGGEFSKNTRKRFKLQNDPISGFIETQCVVGAKQEVIKGDLYGAYTDFCDMSAVPYYSEMPFFRELYSRYSSLKAKRSQVTLGGNQYRQHQVIGIDLKPEEEDNATPDARQG